METPLAKMRETVRRADVVGRAEAQFQTQGDSSGESITQLQIQMLSLGGKTGLKTQNTSHQYMSQDAITEVVTSEIEQRGPSTKPWATIELDSQEETGEDARK